MSGAGVLAPFRLLIWDVQSAINLGMILRVAETFAVTVDIWDPRGALDDPEKTCWISDFSCGAYHRGAYRRLTAEPERGSGPGRFIATCLSEDAVDLEDFTFHSDDIVAVGNEYDGLPESVITLADIRLRISMPAVSTPKLRSISAIDPDRADFVSANDEPVLSAAMSAGILCYAAYAQRLALKSRA